MKSGASRNGVRVCSDSTSFYRSDCSLITAYSEQCCFDSAVGCVEHVIFLSNVWTVPAKTSCRVYLSFEKVAVERDVHTCSLVAVQMTIVSSFCRYKQQNSDLFLPYWTACVSEAPVSQDNFIQTALFFVHVVSPSGLCLNIHPKKKKCLLVARIFFVAWSCIVHGCIICM